MLEGVCPNCGQKFYGMALANPRYQACDACGTSLDVRDGERIIKGFSPFSGENIGVKPRQPEDSPSE